MSKQEKKKKRLNRPMHIMCPPPPLPRLTSYSPDKGLCGTMTRANREKFKQVVIIFPTLLHTSNYRKHKQKQREGGSHEEAKKQSSNVSGGGQDNGRSDPGCATATDASVWALPGFFPESSAALGLCTSGSDHTLRDGDCCPL